MVATGTEKYCPVCGGTLVHLKSGEHEYYCAECQTWFTKKDVEECGGTEQ